MFASQIVGGSTAYRVFHMIEIGMAHVEAHASLPGCSAASCLLNNILLHHPHSLHRLSIVLVVLVVPALALAPSSNLIYSNFDTLIDHERLHQTRRLSLCEAVITFHHPFLSLTAPTLRSPLLSPGLQQASSASITDLP